MGLQMHNFHLQILVVCVKMMGQFPVAEVAKNPPRSTLLAHHFASPSMAFCTFSNIVYMMKKIHCICSGI